MDRLGFERAVVGDISMGAEVALNLALRHPKRAARLGLSRPAWLDSPMPGNLKAYPVVAQLLREHGVELGREHFEGTEEYAELERAAPGAGCPLASSQFGRPRAGGGDEALKESVLLWSADLVEVGAALKRGSGGDARPPGSYSAECVECAFGEVRRLVLLRRSGLGTLFEGVIHLLKPPLRFGLKAPGEQGNEQTLERFSLEESNTVLLQRLDGEGVLTIEHTRHQ